MKESPVASVAVGSFPEVSSSMTAVLASAEQLPERVVNIGTAGALRDASLADVITLVEEAVAGGATELPEPSVDAAADVPAAAESAEDHALRGITRGYAHAFSLVAYRAAGAFCRRSG